MIKLEELQKLSTVSQKHKTVKRSWKTKTGVKSKEYVYAESPLLFKKTKTGYKLDEKAWNEFEENIKKTLPNKAAAIINEARRIKNDILHGNVVAKYGGNKQYSSKLQKGWNRIDVKSMVSRLATSSVEKYLNNMGLTSAAIVDYVKEETDKIINEADLLNPGNWKNDTCYVTATDGTRLELTIKFSYSGLETIKIKIN